jgi:hypothetical protein
VAWRGASAAVRGGRRRLARWHAMANDMNASLRKTLASP